MFWYSKAKAIVFLDFHKDICFQSKLEDNFYQFIRVVQVFFRSLQFLWWFLHWVAHTSCPFFLILYFKAFATWNKGISWIISMGFHKSLIQTQFWISSWIFYMNIFLLLCFIVQLAFIVFCKTKAWGLLLNEVYETRAFKPLCSIIFISCFHVLTRSTQ